MIAKLFIALINFAWFRRLTWRPFYNYLALKFPVADWQFMNYGYMPNSQEATLVLKDEDKIQIYPLQLYHYLAVKAIIADKDILEVGSGRGGGARYVAEYLNPASFTGMDIAQNAVDLSNKLHHLPNLKFIQGNAEAIPLKDNCMDVVINVESSHAYGSVDRFLSEVKRVLKPGGYLLLTDVRDVKEMQFLQTQFQNSGMELLEEDDITINVVNAIEAEDHSKRSRIAALIPIGQQKLFSEFAGITGSQLHLSLKKGERRYFRFVLRKRS